MPEALEKIAKILRIDRNTISGMTARLAAVTGKENVIEEIVNENESLIQKALLALGVPRDASAKEVYEALISKVEADDYQIFRSLGTPDCKKVSDCQKVADIARRVANPPKGFFLKLDKAREFLAKEPPRQIMAFLGYGSVQDMLAKEDLFEVMSALRFVEGNEWLNRIFFKQYEGLTPEDFEEREIVVKALSTKWGEEAQQFTRKKHHNISHLKELGVVFVIPTLLGISGEVLRMFSLLIHYLYEIPFYSDLFKRISRDRATFTKNFISLLRGDVWDKRLPEGDKSTWLVIQRYLAKDDVSDWRLFQPHINPEALHWFRAEENLSRVSEELNGFAEELLFWKGLGWVGDYFKDESGVEVLASFNLVDTVMSLVKQKQMVKYLYHHQEALWNKIFEAYFGREKLEQYSREYLLKGYFEI